MSESIHTDVVVNVKEQASLDLVQGNYDRASQLYQQAIDQCPEQVTFYWYLGLSLLLQGKESEAQMVWNTPIAAANSEEQQQQWICQLAEVLQTEAARQENNQAFEQARLLDRYLRELTQQLMHQAAQYYQSSSNEAAAKLASVCVELVPNDQEVLFTALKFLQRGGTEYLLQSIAVAERCVVLSQNLPNRILALDTLLTSWIASGGNWNRATQIYREYKAAILEFLSSISDSTGTPDSTTEPQTDRPTQQGFIFGLLSAGSVFFYFEDHPSSIRPIRNALAQVAQTHLQAALPPQTQRYRQQIHSRKNKTRNRLPKIGYLAATFRQHSVGWLCRWLMQYHDRSRFEIHLYSSRQSDDVIQRSLIREYGDHFHFVPTVVPEIADRICQDKIDILVELDSLSSFSGCGVVALKPAPIQVHWLGYDSSGVPNVDYFIVDPYVLPEQAQDYYCEKLWKLPHTFIAVDGFEIGTPSLRRDQLNIPSDAIVYLSSQTGMKRNAMHARLQLQILKHVSNSYFLIKSHLSHAAFVEAHFKQLAEEEGVAIDRLRFLPDEPSEFIHRANLGLADVVLDTYPYSGATTTLEALWMGLPIVTRVGEQFAARNSYSMMINSGITAGLAWSDNEYLEWGIRLGTDARLRETIFHQLCQSRHTSPLWNGQQFARDMEDAYEQMWQRYSEK